MNCINLAVIPQFGGTCWFNAILMISLYSQETRKVLIKSSKTWDTNNKFLMILKAVAIKYYNNPDKVQKLFNKIKPELILFKMIKTYNDYELLNAYKSFLKKNISNLAWVDTYITKFFRYINLKCMDITYINGTYLINFDKIISMRNDNGNIKLVINPHTFINDKLIKETKKELLEIPDILIIFHNDVHNFITRAFSYYYSILTKEEQAIFNPSFKKYKFKVENINTYDDIIYLNGHKYKLDATTLANFNIGNTNHAIAGITCNGNRYVYNGWSKQSTDPAFQNQAVDNVNPCSLMQYNWNLNIDNEFCLNPATCQLDFLKQKDYINDLCFSFAKGSRTLIYVRVDDKIDIDINEKIKIKNNLNISNASEIIKDIHDINNLTNEELINQLAQTGFIFVPNYNYTREILQQLLYDQLKNYYNINSDYKTSKKTTSKNKSLKNEINENKISRNEISNFTYNKLIKLKKQELIKLALEKNSAGNYINKTKDKLVQIILGNDIEIINKPNKKQDLLTKVKAKYPFIKCLNKYNIKELEGLLK